MVDTSVQFQNIAGVPVYKEDGNLTPEATAAAPRVLIIGTAGKGMGNRAFIVPSTTAAKAEFGIEGTLLRGMWEAKAAGAQEIALYRVGAESAWADGVGKGVGTTSGYKIETYQKDEDAGTNYSFYYDDTADRLVVKRNSDNLIVYDNLESAPINRGEVIVSGYRSSVGGPDVGGPSSFVNLTAATGAGITVKEGTDGLNLSKMEMYEKLYVAYEHVKELDFDVVVPMDVYLDDYNTINQGHYLGPVTPESNSGADDTYPTAGRYRPGQDVDSLGRVYVEEYEGEYYFWWSFAATGATANVFPSIGDASATTKIDNTPLAEEDFHEVNFAYQLARFLYEYSTNVVDATGVIGVLPPASDSLADKARWLGKAPTWTLDTANNVLYVASTNDNGTGLLGNKFMAGQYEHRSGVYGGGFIATEGQFMDSGAEILDSNEIPVDLGKYLSVVGDYPILRNSYSPTAYPSSFAASYAGFYISLSPASAPTNKTISNASIVFKFGLRAIDELAGTGYVMLRQKTTGLKIADAPTAAMPTSDWIRLSTVRITKEVVDGVRTAIDPYLGEAFSGASRAAMKTSIEKVLLAAKKAGFLRDYKPFEIIQTPDMAVQGKADVSLTLVPAFELRQVTLTVSLAKQ